MYKDGTYNSNETIGVSLTEALERYRKYERKLVDNVKPNEETLKKLSSTPNISLAINQAHFKANNLSNNELKRFKDLTYSPDLTMNGEDSANNSNSDAYRFTVRPQSNQHRHKLSALNRSNSISFKNTKFLNSDNKQLQQSPPQQVNKPNDSSNKNSKNRETNDESSADMSENEESSKSNAKIQEIAYNLETILKYLEEGYYLR
jgi:hypothetical protein